MLFSHTKEMVKKRQFQLTANKEKTREIFGANVWNLTSFGTNCYG